MALVTGGGLMFVAIIAVGIIYSYRHQLRQRIYLLYGLGGLFVMETASVMLQVARFRLSRRRFFRMAPIHHHFELGGWPETTVIIRFWILSGLCTAAGLGIFYADSIAKGITK